MIDGFIKDGETKEQIIEKLISYFKMDKEKAKEHFDKTCLYKNFILKQKRSVTEI